jgi:hypothetical protein
MYVDVTNIIWILAFGILLGTVVSIELRGRPALRTSVLILTGISGMVVGDVVAGLILGDAAGQMLWVRHPIQFVGAGVLLLALVLTARWSEARRATPVAAPIADAVDAPTEDLQLSAAGSDH